MGLIKEFKEFAVKGNVIDLAVAVIIGGAIGKVISSLVTDVIMPPIGLLLGGVDFKELRIILKEATVDTAEVAIRYGAFLNVIIDFVIIAFAIFMLIKGINSLKKKEEAKPSAPPKEEVLLTEIRDLLKAKKN
ncbi:MAG TPA: large-conductance mechanosensitive channel protein MscL [Candidatus Woesearchaeota archaeon]|nr:large-conductance mechanosensitive channel protein MscL [Candidatus Woesearchaeota archaeon]